MKEDSVVKDREKYIGGSDIPIIMGISPFKTRWELILDKTEEGHRKEIWSPQIEYGNNMEATIREFVSAYMHMKFVPDVKIVGDLRGNCDGLAEYAILEVKTTSQIHSSIEGYKHFLVQLLFYMHLYRKDLGILAVYERPKDYSLEFDSERLQIFSVHMADYADLMEEILNQVDMFRADLEKVRENPFLTEQDLQPKEITVMVGRIVTLEKQLALYKELQTEYDNLRERLAHAMGQKGYKSWSTNSGVKFTYVAPTEDKVVQKFDDKAFKAEQPDIYKKYLVDSVKKGSKEYVRITFPKK